MTETATESKKRHPTKYVGVFYYYVHTHGGRVVSPTAGDPAETRGGPPRSRAKKEKMFIVTFKRPGERRQHEVTIGRESKGITVSQANAMRSEYVAGKKTRQEDRAEKKQRATLTQHEATRKAVEDFTVDDAFKKYTEIQIYGGKAQDSSRYKLHIKSHCGDTPVSKLDPIVLEEIKVAAFKKGMKPQTVKHVLALLRRMILWCKRKKLCTLPDDLEFDMPKFDNEVTHEHYNEEELAVLIRKLEAMEKKCPVGSGFLQCAIYTGLRPIQLQHLKWTDIDFQRNTMTVRSKGMKQGGKFVLPVNELAKGLFERLSKHDAYVFPSSRGGMLGDYRYQIFKALDDLELPENFRPVYSLRHNFASWFASLDGTDIYMLRELLTHTDIRTTQRYAHLFDRDKKKQADRIATTLKETETKHKDEFEGKDVVGRIRIRTVESGDKEKPTRLERKRK